MNNTNWKRQHPTAIFIGFLGNLKELVFTIFAVLIFGQQFGGGNFYIIFFSIILVFSIVSGIIKWITFRYQLVDNELQVRQGFLFRKRRYIRKERIQSIDINAKFIQRLFHLVELRIETAGGGAEPEFRILALNEVEAQEIKTELLKKDSEKGHSNIEEVLDGRNVELIKDEPMKEQEEIVLEKDSVPIFHWKLTTRRLFIAAITSSGIGIAATFVAAVMSQVQQLIPDELYERAIGLLLHSSILIIGFWIVLILLIGWIITLISTLLKYGQFTVKRKDNEVHISRGILEKRQLTLSANRITAVRLVQNLLRQPFGYVAVYVESAGGGTKDEDLSTVLIPMCKQSEVNEILNHVIPEFAVERKYSRLPKQSVRRYMIRLLIPTTIIACILTYFFTYGWLAFSLVIGAVGYGYWQYYDAGIGRDSKLLWIRSRAIARTEVIVPRRRIQAFTVSQSYLQRFDNLHSLHLSIITSIIGKTFSLRHISQSQSEDCLDWYSYEE